MPREAGSIRDFLLVSGRTRKKIAIMASDADC